MQQTVARWLIDHDPDVVQPGNIVHSIGAFVMAALLAGFGLAAMDEYAADAVLAARGRCRQTNTLARL